MKSKRQNKILELIESHEIETQEELVGMLNEANFQVTQATISRDIKDLQLIKVQTSSGNYKYAVTADVKSGNMDVLLRIFRDTCVSIDCAMNLIVIKTLTGSASAAAEVIDGMHIPGVLGTIAGDNTIFLAADSEQTANDVRNQFAKIVKKQEQ